MADWNTPSTSTLYTDVLAYLKDRDVDLAKMFDGVGSNVPTGAIKFSAANKRFEKWSGSAWGELIAKASDKYDINVDRVDGYDVSASATASTIPVRDASGALTGLLISAGSAAAPGLAVAGDPDTGIYASAANALSVAAAGALAATFSGSGIYTPNRLGVGTSISAVGAISIGGAVLSGAGQYGILNQPTFSSAATTLGMGYYANPAVEDSAFTMGALYGYRAHGFTKGAAATVNAYYAFSANDEGEAAANYAFHGAMSASGTAKWNVRMDGTAPNYLNGKTYIGAIYSPLTATLSTDGRLNINTNYTIATAYEAGLAITNYRNNDNCPALLDLAHSKSNTVGTVGAVGAAALLGRIRFLGADGTAFSEAARIDVLAAGSVSAGIVPGYWQVGVADDLGALSTRLAVNPAGVLLAAQNAQRGPALSTTVPAKVNVGGAAYTDTATAASGTVTHGVGTSIPSFQLAASNTGVTYTAASTLYVSGAPTAGTNVTITNPYSVYVAGGNEIHAGYMRIGGTTAPTVALDVTGAISATLPISSDYGLTTAGYIRSSAATSGIGYATGAGGTVTQSTSKSTGVTLNKICGEVTMHNAALAADTAVSFDITNSAVTAGDRIVINHVNSGTMGGYTVNAYAAGGKISVTVRNVTGGSLSEAIVLGFAVFKAVLS